MEKEIVCISCPIGCSLRVSYTDPQDVRVEGNQCPRGEIYGREEVLSPKRIVTATCRAEGKGISTRVPVKTDRPLPKELIDDLLNTLYTMTVSLPVETGETVITDIAGSGVNLVVSAPVFT